MSTSTTIDKNGTSIQPFSSQNQRAALVEAAAQREIAQVQAAMIIAQRFPRDRVKARDAIMNACTDIELAKVATYEYARGGTRITGASIRLAEVIAQFWGNLDVGWSEVEQRPGESIAEAWCWDLESNSRQRRTFYVKHVRDTREGRKVIEDSRDIYEHVANNAARRLRACILAMVPRNVVDSAINQCDVTLETTTKVTPELLKEIEAKFGQYNVTKEQIEKFIQRRIQAIAPAQVVRLNGIYNSIRDGMSKPADWFAQAEGPAAEAPQDGEGPKSRTAEVADTLGTTVGSTPAVDKSAPERTMSDDETRIKARDLRAQIAKVWKGVDNHLYASIIKRETKKGNLVDLTLDELQDFLDRSAFLRDEV